MTPKTLLSAALVLALVVAAPGAAASALPAPDAAASLNCSQVDKFVFCTVWGAVNTVVTACRALLVTCPL